MATKAKLQADDGAVPALIDRGVLAKTLALVMGAVERHNTIPVLSNLALHHAGGRLEISGTNLDQTVTVEIDSAGGDDFATTANGGRLLALVKSMAVAEVALSIDGKGRLVVAGDDASAALMTIAFHDFPAPTIVEGVEVELNAAQFAADLRFVAPAISTEETRYYLNGVCLWAREGDTAMVATDGHRLHMASMPPVTGMPARQPILPARFVELVQALVAGNPDEQAATIAFHGASKVSFSIGPWRLVSKVIDGQFPDWRRVVPAPAGVEVKVASKAIAEAIGIATAISDEKTRAVAFHHEAGGLVAACTSPENGQSRAKVRGAEVPAFDFTIGFNAKYLVTVTRMFAGADLVVQLVDPAAPVLCTAPAVPGRQIVVMPLRV